MLDMRPTDKTLSAYGIQSLTTNGGTKIDGPLISLWNPGVFARLRWPNGVVRCIKCGETRISPNGLRKHGRHKIRQYVCSSCQQRFNEYVNTPLQDACIGACEYLAMLYWRSREQPPPIRDMAKAVSLPLPTTHRWLTSRLVITTDGTGRARKTQWKPFYSVFGDNALFRPREFLIRPRNPSSSTDLQRLFFEIVPFETGLQRQSRSTP